MIKAFLISLVVAGGMLLPAAVFAAAPSNPLGDACSKIQGGQTSPACEDAKATKDGDKTNNPIYGSGGIINNVANAVALVAGAIAVIYMILGGFRMITSTGDSAAFKEARSTLIYGSVGLVVVAFARAIVGFVLGRLG